MANQERFNQLAPEQQAQIMRLFLQKKFYRRYFNGQDYVLNDDQSISLINEEIKPILITGTRLRMMLAPNIFESDLQVWSRFLGFSVPIWDEKYVLSGYLNEPKLVAQTAKLIQSQAPQHQLVTFSPDPYVEEFNYFRNLDGPLMKLFGGLPDAFLADRQNSQVALINDQEQVVIDPRQNPTPKILLLECKTAQQKKRATFNERGIDPAYFYQATLYAYLLNLSQYQIVVGYLEPEQYLQTDVEFGTHNFQIFNFKLKDEQMVARFEDDLRLALINYCKTFLDVAQLPISEQQQLQTDEQLLEQTTLQMVTDVQNWLAANNIQVIDQSVQQRYFVNCNQWTWLNQQPLTAAQFCAYLKNELQPQVQSKFVVYPDSYSYSASGQWNCVAIVNNQLVLQTKKLINVRGVDQKHAQARWAAQMVAKSQITKPDLKQLSALVSVLLNQYWQTNVAKKTSPQLVFSPSSQKGDQQLWEYLQINNQQEWNDYLWNLYWQSLNAKENDQPTMNLTILENQFNNWLEHQDWNELLAQIELAINNHNNTMKR